jgi:LPXTG-motif cell wall-anchored protein
MEAKINNTYGTTKAGYSGKLSVKILGDLDFQEGDIIEISGLSGSHSGRNGEHEVINVMKANGATYLITDSDTNTAGSGNVGTVKLVKAAEEIQIGTANPASGGGESGGVITKMKTAGSSKKWMIIGGIAVVAVVAFVIWKKKKG